MAWFGVVDIDVITQGYAQYENLVDSVDMTRKQWNAMNCSACNGFRHFYSTQGPSSLAHEVTPMNQHIEIPGILRKPADPCQTSSNLIFRLLCVFG